MADPQAVTANSTRSAAIAPRRFLAIRTHHLHPNLFLLTTDYLLLTTAFHTHSPAFCSFLIFRFIRSRFSALMWLMYSFPFK